MPLGYQRLNEKKQRPNENINFYKPLSGPDHDTAHDFLSRVAAISAPIMRAHVIGVNSLEEFPPNKEFLGRNFNNGECIQLVLKSQKTGRWLPFRFVQKVFMHELAHVHQMNHGREFWKLRNNYCEALQELWGKDFLGEGLWGRGQTLYTGQISDDTGLSAAEQGAVRATCGGSYRGVRGRGKRGRVDKPQLTYAEREQRRVKKKFGEGGQSLGDDDERRTTLEKGKKVKGKPRVAGSNRGRDLRAAAALARFDPIKAEPEVKPEQDDSDFDTDYASEYGDGVFGEEAKGPDGQRLLDGEGKRLVKICEGDDEADDENARREMEELGAMGQQLQKRAPTKQGARDIPLERDEADISTASESEGDTQVSTPTTSTTSPKEDVVYGPKPRKVINKGQDAVSAETHGAAIPVKPNQPSMPECRKSSSMSAQRTSVTKSPPSRGKGLSSSDCPVCSLQNEPEALTCLACAHVLRPDSLPNTWRCGRDACKESAYVNSGDVGLCGLCGLVKA